MELISRKEAKAQGLKRYFTGLACKQGHVSDRLVSNRNCCACLHTPERKAKIAACKQTPEAKGKRAVREGTPEAKAKMAARNQKPKTKAAKKAWKIANPCLVAGYAKKPEAKVKAALRSKTPEYKAKAAAYYRANPAARAALGANYRAAKLERTPKWLTKADKAAIKAIYEQCAFTSHVTGEKHHVDHIIPLQGKFISGLHVPLNLQILTATENVTKSNKLLEQFA